MLCNEKTVNKTSVAIFNVSRDYDAESLKIPYLLIYVLLLLVFIIQQAN